MSKKLTIISIVVLSIFAVIFGILGFVSIPLMAMKKKGRKPKKKISIDLDVVTVGLWKKKDPRKREALEMLERIKNKEFFLVSLSSLVKLPEKWKNKKLAEKITKYYFEHTNKYFDDTEIFEGLKKAKINIDKLLSEFSKRKIKEEDVLLVLASSLNEATVVTMNRRHLRDSEDVINEILEKFGLRKIKIRYPRELKKKTQRENFSNSFNLLKDSLKTALFISSANFTGSVLAGIKASFFIAIAKLLSIIKFDLSIFKVFPSQKGSVKQSLFICLSLLAFLGLITLASSVTLTQPVNFSVISHGENVSYAKSPRIISASVEPSKVRAGDIMLITAEVQDD